jgi:drug/metabolite transporter (DMT)-like permease
MTQSSTPETPHEPFLSPAVPLPPDVQVETGSLALRPRLAGAGLCATSAAGFASLTILGKLAFNANLNLVSILSLRFGCASILLGLYLGLFKRRRLFLGLRQSGVLFLLGALGYAGQSSLYFGALERNPAALNGLLLYIYPAMVALLGWLLNRSKLSRREWLAMLIALAGVVLTLQGDWGLSLADPLDPLGVAMVLGSALWYAGYILISDRLVHAAGAWVSTAWITLGAGTSFTLGGLVTGSLDWRLPPAGWVILLAMILLSTIMALGTFLAGMRLVGPTAASLLSTLEPVFTVALAILILKEGFTPAQALGGALVLAAVVLLSLPQRRSKN